MEAGLKVQTQVLAVLVAVVTVVLAVRLGLAEPLELAEVEAELARLQYPALTAALAS